jgi:hypothetical protein
MKSPFLICAATALSCSSAKVTESADNSDPTPFMNTITANELKTHLYIVADGMEGRETSSAGQKSWFTLSINM